MYDVREIFDGFSLPGEFVSSEELRIGHIHATFVSTSSEGKRYVHQRFNTAVFQNVEGVMRNLRIVTEHLKEKYAERREPLLCVLEIHATKRGGDLYEAADGSLWRTFTYIEDSRSFDTCDTPERGATVARIFAQFQKDMFDLPRGVLTEPIPHFMDCERRYDAFVSALARDEMGRASGCEREIEFVYQNADVFSLLNASPISRPTHGDMKLNNVLFSIHRDVPLCVVDLDTCMEGSWLFDFGDLVRVSCATAREEEGDERCIDFRTDIFKAILSAYREEVKGFLTAEEDSVLPIAPQVLALTVGTRFLTDYLNGDRYFRVSFPAQNLIRSRNQFALFRRMKK